MAEYYDYGALGNTSAPLVPIKNTSYSQVYAATHKGEKYLPFMDRSFISFSYGGKNIEDFDLIATIENNSLQRKAYAEFNDIVTQSDVYDGQLYWSSHFEPNVLDFNETTISKVLGMQDYNYIFVNNKWYVHRRGDVGIYELTEDVVENGLPWKEE